MHNSDHAMKLALVDLRWGWSRYIFIPSSLRATNAINCFMAREEEEKRGGGEFVTQPEEWGSFYYSGHGYLIKPQGVGKYMVVQQNITLEMCARREMSQWKLATCPSTKITLSLCKILFYHPVLCIASAVKRSELHCKGDNSVYSSPLHHHHHLTEGR